MKIQLLLSFCLTLKYISCNEIKTCGGAFTGFQYPITSPNYPNDYPSNKDCVYTLKGSEFSKCFDQEFHLQFLDFQLETSNGCEKDYLKVNDENIYCGNNSIGIRKFKSSENKSLKLIFHSDKNVTAKGFRIIVTALKCVDENQNGTRFDDPVQQIQDITKSGSVINPSEKFELPQEFKQQQQFHDRSENHDIGSVTSYLYLPPPSSSSPLKINGVKTLPNPNKFSLPTVNSDQEIVIRNFEDIADVSSEFRTPYNQIRHPFIQRIFHKTRTSFEPSTTSSSRWELYGTPNSQSPSITNHNNFDPFADNNNNNNNPGVNYNPNCGGGNGGNNNNFNPGENVNPYYYYYPNNVNNDDMNFAVNNYPNNNNYYGTDDTTYSYDSSGSECCGTIYSSSNFLLTSKKFPSLIYSSTNYDCRYTIQRSSQNICGLEMYLKFFNFGSDDQFCAYGYVEIDGRRLCGCQTGMNITSTFDNIATKIMTVKYLGYPRNKFSGFVIEVSQISCSTNYLRIRNDADFRTDYDVESFRRNFNKRSFDENQGLMKIRGKRNAGYYYPRPAAGIVNQELISSQKLQFVNTCRIFKFLNWVKAAKQVYLKSAQCSKNSGTSSSVSVIPIFPDLVASNSAIINFSTTTSSAANCEAVNIVQGTLSSPYYPNDYSNNLNQCYRFYKAPGFCQLELAILDFDLENSTICRKDYVSFGGQKRRYCGTSLTGSQTIIDMTRTDFADLYFVTDSSGTGRGFRAGFSQISC